MSSNIFRSTKNIDTEIYKLTKEDFRYSYNAYSLIKEVINYKSYKREVLAPISIEDFLSGFKEYVELTLGELAPFVLKKLGITKVKDIINILQKLKKTKNLKIKIDKIDNPNLNNIDIEKFLTKREEDDFI